MLQENNILFFRKNGYLIIRNLYPKDSLQKVRYRLENLFSAGVYEQAPSSNPHIINNLYSYAPEILPLIFTDKYLEIVRQILGPTASWIPECAVHRERFFGWHKDSSGVERAGMKSHIGYEYPMITVATYFQDNGPGAGGLTVIPGTQGQPDQTLDYYKGGKLLKIKCKALKWLGKSELDRLERHPQKIDLPSQFGDLVIFDIRLFHRATFPRQKSPVEKLAIFNAFVRNDEVGRAFMQYQKRRPEPYYLYLRENPPPAEVYAWAAKTGMEVLY